MECVEISYLTFPKKGIIMLLFILVRVNHMHCLSIAEYPVLVRERSVFPAIILCRQNIVVTISSIIFSPSGTHTFSQEGVIVVF